MHIGKTRGTLIGGAAIVLAVGVIWPGPLEQFVPGWSEHTTGLRTLLSGVNPAHGQTNDAPPPAAPVPVDFSKAQKGPLPLRISGTGSVQAVATVEVRSRIDGTIASLPVGDGADVKAGQVIAQLDTSQIDAQIEQAKASLAKDQSVVDQNQRDLGHAQDLLKRGAGPQQTVDTDTATFAADQATVKGDQAQIDNLNVQRSWYTLTAPMDGKLGAFSAKVGNILRSADTSTAGVLVTVNQMTPIYVAFAVTQAQLPDIRQALAANGGEVIAVPQGLDPSKAPKGKIAFISNSIDPTTGDVMVYATFDNAGEVLWPGQYCNITVNVRVDQNIVSVPQDAVQQGQESDFVFTVNDGTAHFQPIKVSRVEDGRAVIIDGLKGGENVVTDGQFQLTDGSKVVRRAANSPPPNADAPM